jgi:hypothetical protein
MPINIGLSLMIGGKTSTIGYPASIHLESFWRIQLKLLTAKRIEKNILQNEIFSNLTKNHLLDLHTAAVSITKVAAK